MAQGNQNEASRSQSNVLTHEDHQIFALLMSVKAQSRLHQADRTAARTMMTREFEKRRALPDERWETHRREWFPSGWGL